MRPDPFYGFLVIYIGLISMTYVSHALFFSEIFINYNYATNFSSSTALVSLTQISDNIFITNLPNSYIIFSLIITQISGTTILSYLLYYCWKLFGQKHQKSMNAKSAFVLTNKISLMVEGCLLLFFLYAIPIQLTNMDFEQKFMAAISLAINSFFTSGFTHNAHFFHEGVINQSFLIQIGTIGGITIGGLGIFVINELFSPIKLRERLANPAIDWTFITKTSVFGGAFVVALASAYICFFKSEIYWPEKNMIETIIATIFQVSSARSFGFSITPADHSWVRMIVSIFGAGPFSTGGGITLLSIAFLVGLLTKKGPKSMDFKMLSAILKRLMVYSLVSFIILTSLLWFAKSEISFAKIFMDQLDTFTILDLHTNSHSNTEIVLVGFTNLAGRIGFIVVCFLTLKRNHQEQLEQS